MDHIESLNNILCLVSFNDVVDDDDDDRLNVLDYAQLFIYGSFLMRKNFCPKTIVMPFKCCSFLAEIHNITQYTYFTYLKLLNNNKNKNEKKPRHENLRGEKNKKNQNPFSSVPRKIHFMFSLFPSIFLYFIFLNLFHFISFFSLCLSLLVEFFCCFVHECEYLYTSFLIHAMHDFSKSPSKKEWNEVRKKRLKERNWINNINDIRHT